MANLLSVPGMAAVFVTGTITTGETFFSLFIYSPRKNRGSAIVIFLPLFYHAKQKFAIFFFRKTTFLT